MRPAPLRKSFLDVIQLRERAHRLLRRRISPLVHHYVGNDLRRDLTQFCTENTYHHCILFISYPFHVVQFPGGYLFHFWLLCSGPGWVLKMLKESFEVLLPIRNRILKYDFCQAKLPVHPDVMALLLQMTDLRSQFLAWLAGEMRLLSQKRNKLAWLETLQLKVGGATGSALKMSNKKSR